MLTIAVDAMGGDHAPKAEVEGAIEAVRNLGVKVVLVGQQALIQQELARHADSRKLPIEIVQASERITMEDSAAKAVRSKRDSSLRVASRMVRDGLAAGIRVGGQHRRGDGHGQDGAGRGAGSVPAGAGGRLSHGSERLAGGGAGRGRQRGLLRRKCWRSSR